MARRGRNVTMPWLGLTRLAWEAAALIPLRLARSAAMEPAAARREGERMVSEKLAAAAQAGATLATGGSPAAVVRQVRRKVRSNSKRMLRP